MSLPHRPTGAATSQEQRRKQALANEMCGGGKGRGVAAPGSRSELGNEQYSGIPRVGAAPTAALRPGKPRRYIAILEVLKERGCYTELDTSLGTVTGPAHGLSNHTWYRQPHLHLRLSAPGNECISDFTFPL
ncbi:uncharacterized protein LOC117099724 [Trachypithecus francoisi]|uniref:uncharacterized protein LOC117099724 n=1 Tax=Trachypithecus francoisi TaxID=54180 RepID=UPI00141BA083|nr:uncharacterized protein LOC117099724 [Trachypithecus francoisi]